MPGHRPAGPLLLDHPAVASMSLLLLAAAVAIVAADVWLSLPQILYAFRPSLIQTGFSEGVPRILSGEQTQRSVRTLEDAGFVQLGARWERVWWGDTRSWEISFVRTTDLPCFAGVARTGRLNRQFMHYLLTPFADGSFALTWELDFDAHARACGERTPALEPTRKGRIDACRAYYRDPMVMRRRRRRGLATTGLAVIAAAIVMTAYIAATQR